MTGYETHLEAAEAALEAARRALADEIGAYPGPVAGCDAQFNHLLSERQRIADALAALRHSPPVATSRDPVPAPTLR